jgi:small GTP-binding protein
MNATSQRPSIKVCLCGSTSVGKTCICSRAVHDLFPEGGPETVGAASYALPTTTKSGNEIALKIWDTAGGERWRSLIPSYFRDAAFCLLVFSLEDETSFDELNSYWFECARSSSPPSAKFVLIGNKSDLEGQRVISSERAHKYSDEIGAIGYYETSALNGSGVRELFAGIGYATEMKPTMQSEPVLTPSDSSQCC